MTKKKYFVIGVLALSIATLSGCADDIKTLECTKTSDSEGMKMNELIKYFPPMVHIHEEQLLTYNV